LQYLSTFMPHRKSSRLHFPEGKKQFFRSIIRKIGNKPILNPKKTNT